MNGERSYSPRPRPQSVHAFAFPPPTSSSSSHPTSPPLVPAPAPPGSPRRRPTHQGHRTAASMSSLAHLNLNHHQHPQRSSPPLDPPSTATFSYSHAHSPVLGGPNGHRLERSNSVLASPSTHWGPFAPTGAGAGGGADYEDVQNRTFCKWVNSHLESHGYEPVTDLGHDFCDGTRLIQLLEILSESSIGRYNLQPRHRIQKMENTKQALERIKEMGVHLTNVGPEDIVDGNRKLILGVIWSLVLTHSIADIAEDGTHAKAGLLLWCQNRTAGYAEVDVQDFTRSWQDGLAFCALIHRHRPDLLDFDALAKDNSRQTAEQNLATAFRIAEESLGIPQLLEVEDICGARRPDERSIMTYVASFFHAFSSRAQAETETRLISQFAANMEELLVGVHDYERRVTALLAALSSHLSLLSAPLPPSLPYAKLQSLLAEGLQTHRTLRPAWLAEKRATAELLGVIREKLRTYGLRGYEPEMGLRVEDVAAKWTDLRRAERARHSAISAEIRRLQDEARAAFADAAERLQDEVHGVEDELASIGGPLEAQLAALSSLAHSRLSPLRTASLAALSTSERACLCVDAFSDLLPSRGVDGSVLAAYGGFEEAEREVGRVEEMVRRRRAFVEGQITARRAPSIAPEKLEEWESAFRQFDTESKGRLGLDELAGALGGLGILEVNLDEIEQVEDEVSFEEFLRYLTHRSEDRLTGERVRSCFRSIAGEKPYLTDLDLSRLSLPASALSFLRDQMPSRPLTLQEMDEVRDLEASAAKGRASIGGQAYDFEGFLDNFLEE
ncbi:hypothetical protein JCM8097_000465 [Rhodosporidiobolus ruineniae]